MNKIIKKSNNSNSLKTTLIDDISKWKKLEKINKSILEKNYSKKLSKEININPKKIINNQKNIFNNSYFFNEKINRINNNEHTSGKITSRTRNLKTYNIFIKANSIDIDKTKLNDTNNKENYSINQKISYNNLTNNIKNSGNRKNNSINLNININLKCKKKSFGNQEYNNKNFCKKKLNRKNMPKYNTEKALFDNYLFFTNKLLKFNNKKIKKNVKNK